MREKLIEPFVAQRGLRRGGAVAAERQPRRTAGLFLWAVLTSEIRHAWTYKQAGQLVRNSMFCLLNEQKLFLRFLRNARQSSLCDASFRLRGQRAALLQMH